MIPSAPGSWLKPISEKDKAAGKRMHCDIVSLRLVSPKILALISNQDRNPPLNKPGGCDFD